MDKIYSILKKESDAILSIPLDNLYGDVIDVIEHSVHVRMGKLICSGMGKAGQIALNMATTFSSTGTCAVYLHPSEAQHGDLGIVRENDVLLLISNSGKTREIVELITLARNLHPKPTNSRPTLGEAFADLVMTQQDKVESNIERYSTFKLLKTLKPAEQHKKRFNLVKSRRDSVSNCITATCGNPGAAKVCHWDDRAFTVSEIKRIMSVPDDYVLTGSYQQKVERLGRMVAPFMMKAVAENLLTLGALNESSS
jgi:D-arabinose 5-phosphate isomerase GutQ